MLDPYILQYAKESSKLVPREDGFKKKLSVDGEEGDEKATKACAELWEAETMKLILIGDTQPNNK